MPASLQGRAVDEEVRMGGLGVVVMTDDTALTAGFGMEVLARDSAGTPTVVVAPAGRGRIARAAVTAVPRKLRGDSVGYAELWSRVLGSVRRRGISWHDEQLHPLLLLCSGRRRGIVLPDEQLHPHRQLG